MDSHETSIYNAIIVGCVTIGCIIIYFVFSLFRQQRKNVEKQRRDFAYEINSVERDRSRMSRDLHDSAAPLLNTSKFHINEVKGAGEEDRIHIEKANELMDQLLEQLKEIALDLSPGSLARKGLLYALEDFFADIRDAFRLEIVFLYEVRQDLSIEMAIHLYRIVQEISHNTIKHAEARQLRVHFREKRQKLYLFCKDDGIGFDPERASESSKGLGLASLKSRTEILKGKLRCSSKLKYGTEYFFEFPLAGTA